MIFLKYPRHQQIVPDGRTAVLIGADLIEPGVGAVAVAFDENRQIMRGHLGIIGADDPVRRERLGLCFPGLDRQGIGLDLGLDRNDVLLHLLGTGENGQHTDRSGPFE